MGMNAIVKGQKMAITGNVVSNSENIYTVDFTFDSAWDGYIKTAVFQLNANNPVEIVMTSDSVNIPSECLTTKGRLVIGVYGIKDEEVLPVVWGNTLVVQQGTPKGSEPIEPTPDVYAQILEIMQDTRDIASDAYDKAETAQDSARSYAEEAEHYAEVAQQGAEESGYAWFEVNDEDGNMYVTITPNLDEDIQFAINDNTGELEITV